ncbi:MAG: ATP-grasp domain-containing protein [Actinomycetota bacterium]
MTIEASIDRLSATGGAEQPHTPAWTGLGTAFFLGDPQDKLDKEWDSSLRLMAEHGRRGAQAHWVTLDDVLVRGRTLLLGGVAVKPEDVVWLRLDPSTELRWSESLRALCHVDARLVNPPAAVLTVHDKRAALALSPRPSYGVFSAPQLELAVDELDRAGIRRVVLKPPSLFGGRGVTILDLAERDAIRASFAELLPLFGHVLVEPFLSAAAEVRVLMTARRVVGVFERPFETETKKGWPRPIELTPEQRRLAGAAMEAMRRDGIFMAGLDFLGDTLTEINVSCPGAIPEVNLLDPGAEGRIVDDLQAWLAEGR